MEQPRPDSTTQQAEAEAALVTARRSMLQAQHLLRLSDTLRQRALSMGGPGLQLGAQIAETIALLKVQINAESNLFQLDQAALARLMAVTAKARVAAREAASAALEIRALVGGAPGPLRRHLNFPATAGPTLQGITQELQQLHMQVGLLVGSLDKDTELSIIASRLHAIFQLACSNSAAAVEAACAAEKLHIQAVKFINGVQKAILF